MKYDYLFIYLFTDMTYFYINIIIKTGKYYSLQSIKILFVLKVSDRGLYYYNVSMRVGSIVAGVAVRQVRR